MKVFWGTPIERYKGEISRQDDWMRLERHLVRVGTMHSVEATAAIAATETTAGTN